MIFSFLFLFVISLTHASISCNGFPELCEKPYNEVVYPTTHNSTSVAYGRGDVWHFNNQDHGVNKQLHDGIRAFMIDLYENNNTVYTCHKFCILGGRPLHESLQSIKDFLEKNPHEVITLLLESHVHGDQVESIFKMAGLLSYIYTYDKSWPTLGEMIKSNKRVVVFAEEKVGGTDWYQSMWDFSSDTSFSVSSAENFNCDLGRGKKDNSLFIMNHFVTKFWNRRESNVPVNQYDFIVDRAKKCSQERLRTPNSLL